MKRCLILLLCLACLVSMTVLTGCDDKGSSGQNDDVSIDPVVLETYEAAMEKYSAMDCYEVIGTITVGITGDMEGVDFFEETVSTQTMRFNGDRLYLLSVSESTGAYDEDTYHTLITMQEWAIDGRLYINTSTEYGGVGEVPDTEKISVTYDAAWFAENTEVSGLIELDTKTVKEAELVEEGGEKHLNLTLKGRALADVVSDILDIEGGMGIHIDDVEYHMVFDAENNLLSFSCEMAMDYAGVLSYTISIEQQISNVGTVAEIEPPADANEYQDLGDVNDLL